MTVYLLAEPQEVILKKVFSSKLKKPQVSYLFDDTVISAAKAESPVVITDPYINASELKPLLEKNSGLLITSQHRLKNILAHLRHILFVYFKPEQEGIFRYYDPHIASYFFTSLNQQETVQWLGPIEKLEWLNTHWRNRVTQPHQWQQWQNPLAKDWQPNSEKLNTKLVITNNQNLALQDMQEEKFAYHWQQNLKANTAEVDINTAIYWVKQGINLGFWEEQDINQYLTIRSQYPNLSLPENWPDHATNQRLTYLKHHFQQTANQIHG